MEASIPKFGPVKLTDLCKELGDFGEFIVCKQRFYEDGFWSLCTSFLSFVSKFHYFFYFLSLSNELFGTEF